ncbi:thioredoxin domain-containing protein [Gottschalkia acidurici 9a]|uniref:Thioredoxin domain-containing protein n=1 Tax=Gottschalkia acidurici (strain ATCC 7906 / DSM 604 / BCRC 14475 / CIP 104303 / KCTC 5404 / NCIMB 10678 / 9a) TaxID=1128398 RepID=K0AYY5_GOTA9|nr:thioredoxin domain-containing protein [Gottschalkia acidurici]AFS77885.1 thioredoxin domain-containing protein [Gottschalkia acidurici 9a]
MNSNVKTNRLINEKSPYLLQHAYNPVNWYPWDEEAFEKAKQEDKPIFLSIGYSTCHWCHVMERESFEDDEVAEVLNKYFISIKVDREERPDIDSIYMNFCQAMTGSGGWPMTIIMTPDKKPFIAGTYYPKHSMHGRIGIIELLNKVNEKWKSNKDDLINSSEEILEFMKTNIVASEQGNLDMEDIENAFNLLKNSFDPEYGGFGKAPKFPTPHNLNFLLRYYKVKGDESALEVVEKTLESMYKGGIFDHIGYGFARYSVDEKWLVPHFEKMLYDNALLAVAYIEAYQITKRDLYKEIAEKIFEFIEREMTSEEGGFYSAIDADSEGVEGKFYLFDHSEISEQLGLEDSELFAHYYDITYDGNFEGKNIPNLIITGLPNMDTNSVLQERLRACIKKLYTYRNKRVYPHKDDKILTSWNGLMIGALALGGRVFKDDKYIERAERSANFILENLIDREGRLLARYRDGETKYKAYLEDYAYLVHGLIELYQSTFKMEYLEKAIKLNQDMLDLFWDDNEGGLFIYGKDSEQLVLQHKEIYDGAQPSGNSVASLNLIRLSKILEDPSLEEKSKAILKAFGGNVKNTVIGHSYLLMSCLFNIVSTQEIVILGNKNDSDTQEMIDKVNDNFTPFTTVVLSNNSEEELNVIPRLKDYKKVEDKTTAYICKNFTCNDPTADVEQFSGLLKD